MTRGDGEGMHGAWEDTHTKQPPTQRHCGSLTPVALSLGERVVARPRRRSDTRHTYHQPDHRCRPTTKPLVNLSPTTHPPSQHPSSTAPHRHVPTGPRSLMTDLLTGLAPRPSTPVPGVWRVLAPPANVVKVRVFALPPAVVPSSDAEPAPEAPAKEGTPAPAPAPAASTNGLALPGAQRAPTPQPPSQPPAAPIAAPTAAAAASSPAASPRALVDSLRHDPLELAWRKLNAEGMDGVAPDAASAARGLLDSACAVVRPASEGRGRELWVFGGEDELSLDGLTGAYWAP